MSFRTKLLFALGYVVCMAAVVWGMLRFREQAVATYGTPEAQADWQTWRDAATQEANNEGPIKRRAPESDQPPALVLMDEYFPACLGLALLLSSVLYGATALMIYGAVPKPPQAT